MLITNYCRLVSFDCLLLLLLLVVVVACNMCVAMMIAAFQKVPKNFIAISSQYRPRVRVRERAKERERKQKAVSLMTNGLFVSSFLCCLFFDFRFFFACQFYFRICCAVFVFNTKQKRVYQTNTQTNNQTNNKAMKR